MTAPDIVLVIGALGLLATNIGTLILQIITATRVKRVELTAERVEKHTNGMQEAMIASAKKEGAQEEKDKQ